MSPAAPYPVEEVDLLRLMPLVVSVASTVTDDGAEVNVSLEGDVALTVAVLVTEPASTSAWVTV